MKQPTAQDILDSTFKELKKMLNENGNSKQENTENDSKQHDCSGEYGSSHSSHHNKRRQPSKTG